MSPILKCHQNWIVQRDSQIVLREFGTDCLVLCFLSFFLNLCYPILYKIYSFFIFWLIQYTLDWFGLNITFVKVLHFFFKLVLLSWLAFVNVIIILNDFSLLLTTFKLFCLFNNCVILVHSLNFPFEFSFLVAKINMKYVKNFMNIKYKKGDLLFSSAGILT